MVSTIILVNPNAGRGRAGGLARELISRQKILSNALWLEPTDATDAQPLLDQALSDDCQRLIVVGGDGTLNLAVNEVLDKGLGKKVHLSLLPAGTGVDFARTLDPYPTLETLSVVLNRKRSRPVDVLQVNWQNGQHRYAINTVSAGIASTVNATLAADPGRGSGAYLRATVRAFFSYRPQPFTLTLDGKHWCHGDLTLLAIANGSHFGQGMRVAPQAAIDDGQAEVVAVEVMPRGLLLLRLVRIYLGNHLEAPYVHYRQASDIGIRQNPAVSGLDIDGESAPGGDITIRVISDALRFSC
jgi:diacylglycerol kinase (ATP)